MARPPRSPARLIVALAVAGVLAVFLVYTALAGTSTPQVAPSGLAGQKPGKISVVGAVVGPLRGDSPPPLFAVGRHVVVNGSYANGRLLGNGILTKCPSKYTASTTKSY